VISGQERIGDVNCRAVFGGGYIEMNPGLSTFEWLSGQAAGWEKYRFRKLEFMFIPTAATTATPGSIMLLFDFDPRDRTPLTLAAASAYDVQASGRAWETVRLVVPVKRLNEGVSVRRLRCGPVCGDLSSYDPGRLHVMSTAGNGALAGTLWCSYDLELISRQVDTQAPMPTSLCTRRLTISQPLTTGLGAYVDFQTAGATGFPLTETSPGHYTLPCGSYRIEGHVSVHNTDNEVMVASLRLYLGGIQIPGDVTVSDQILAGGTWVLPYLWFVTAATPQTMEVLVVVTAPAGTISLPAARSSLFVSAL
jgi:hypothetical protein